VLNKACLVAVACAGLLGSAQAYVLDFGTGPTPPAFCVAGAVGDGPAVLCNTGNYIAQWYGDVAGVVDVSYNAPRQGASWSLRWWDTSYNNLYGVLWADGSDSNSLGRIDLAPAAGQFVTLNSFELGAWINTTRDTNVAIYDLASGEALYTFSGAVGSAATGATLFTPAVSSTSGLRIEWRDSAHNVGIDNVAFTVSAVPEPAAWALWGAGVLALAAGARRRRTR
jgi:MYXO-CTERM domain-containing protein